MKNDTGQGLGELLERRDDTRPRLDTLTQVTYGLGTFAHGIFAQATGSMLLLYFNQVVGLPVVWVGAAIAIGLVVDAICDPVIGYVSDNWQSRWGRRHSFMYASAIPASLAFYFLFSPPQGWSQEALFVYALVAMIALRVLISVYEIPSAAAGAELTSDYDERTKLMSFRFFFAALGGGLIAVVTYGVLLQSTEQYKVGQLNPEGYSQFGFFGAAVIFVAIMISTLGTHQFIPYMHKPPQQPIRLGRAIKETIEALSNRNYIVLLISGVFSAIYAGFAAGLGLYFQTYFWELNSQQIAIIVSASLLSPFIAVGLSPALGRKLGKKWASISVLMVALFTGITPLSLRLLDLLPPNGSPLLLAILTLDWLDLTTLAIIGFIQLASMIADLTDEVEVKTGRRSEGVLFTADALIKQTLVGVGTFVAGLALVSIEFPQNAKPGEIDPNIMRDLAHIFLPFAAALNVLAIGALAFYSNDRAQHEANLQILRERAETG